MSEAGGDALAAAARALVGTRFRLGGRDPARGLDCFGVLDAALRAIGRTSSLPSGYRQRRIGLPDLDPWFAANTLARCEAPVRAGDVMLLDCGSAQPHLAILTSTGFVHAHARVGRVLETTGHPPWPSIARARLIAA
ncbi:peptidoglycan endopeptidase [Pseudoblastomonas halimionae]|uniref:Peptidoglycan endopeptidase n=1 Tax=Alteriqipengyuania halimionae TaxID=1926630 RepID=A0A6I4U885_9SPHN|nr:peptidoglycan endopeptidase [Alteriqipengyuania halimionae]MXP11015.1 peptidoglycan endopeptidase [Alteriqipengyuania halimionae]